MACFAVAVIASMAAAGQTYSELWGKEGEAWTADSRLPDFSFAGYRFGEVPLPIIPAVANVKDFGARGDGVTDDTEAFRRAIDETQSGAIMIPEGRYLISDILWIRKPDIVLRGEGPDKTVLYFPRELEDVRPNVGATTSGRPTSNYSWSGGFVWVQGQLKSEKLADITSEHVRGEKTLTMGDAVPIEAGQRVQVVLTDDPEKSLLTHLYAGDPGNIDNIRNPVTVSMVSRVTSVDGNRITLERPLRWDIRKEWKPRLQTYNPTVSEVGIEDMAFAFPVKPYEGHFTERGMNAIAMSGVSDCWVRNVRISNCDSGVFMGGMFLTIDGILLDGERKPTRGDTGHHGITLGTDCLLQHFEFRTKFIHDLTVSNLQAGNVFKHGRGGNLSFDHHKRGPHENLFCAIDVGTGLQIWRSGGGRNLGRHTAARATFWAIRSENDIPWPYVTFGPDLINIVGIRTRESSMTEPDGKWLEAIPPEELYPADIHAAQLARRLGRIAQADHYPPGNAPEEK